VIVDRRPYARLGGSLRLWQIDGDSPPQVELVDGAEDCQRAIASQRLPAAGGSAVHRRELEWRPGRLRCHDTVSAPAGALVEHLLQVPAETELHGGGARLGPTRFDIELPAGASLSLEDCRTSERYDSVHRGRRLVVSYRSDGAPGEVTWEITTARRP
jgi:hypothetical protein